MNIIFPLITFPYASNVLQVENLGKVNFASSVCGYFLLFAGLGISSYAVREGSRYVNDGCGISAVMRGDRMMRRLLALDGGYLGSYNSYSSACIRNATEL